MDVAPSSRERIFEAADTLYEDAGRAQFPTVDAVRKAARVNMNDANAGMKEWRRLQLARVAPVGVEVPPAVQAAANLAVGALWRTAQELASESLATAQAAWERDRNEADTLNRQLADAYELQSAELQHVQEQIALDATAIAAANGKLELQQSELAAMALQLRNATAGFERAEVRGAEVERRANDLRNELDHAHRNLDAMRATMAETAGAHETAVQELRAALVSTKAKLEAAVRLAAEKSSQLREENAGLRGQIETLRQSASRIHHEHRITPDEAGTH